MDDDLDYYLAMEEDAQQEQEEWEEDVGMDVQKLNANMPVTATSIVQSEFQGPRSTPVVSSLPARTTLPVPATVAAPAIKTTKITTQHAPVTLSSTLNASTKLNPREFALKMSAERRLAMGELDDEASANAGRKLIQLDAESELHTTRPLYRTCQAAGSFVHDRPPALNSDAASVDSVPCVLADGSRVYLYKRKIGAYGGASSTSASNANASANGGGTGVSSPPPRNAAGGVASPLTQRTLLSKPMSTLIAEADALKVRQMLNKDRVEAEKAAAVERSMFDDVDAEERSPEDGSLWVDKYAPHSFTQLLSPEKINREVLKAVKRWDKYVFKTGEEDPSAANAADSEDCRPKNKVILLCGPPGTGKTTLAHIVARHCGYNAIEINASDDRSPEKLRDAIYNATQNTTLLTTVSSAGTGGNGSGGGSSIGGGNGISAGGGAGGHITNTSTSTGTAHKPNLIILDEIDGIDGSRNALDVLTNIIRHPLHTTGKAKKSGVFALTRPLICICNDQYAPALRDLVRLADVFVFSAPQDVRLIARLRQVCKAENLHITNSNFISELCSATGYDIRASINNLQFAALKSSQERQLDEQRGGHAGEAAAPREGNWGSQFGPAKTTTTTATGGGASTNDKALDIGSVLHSMIKSGLKDDTLDLSQIWRQMFTLNTTSGSGGSADEEGGAKPTKIDHSMRAMDSMLSYGDHSVVIGGIYENVHSMEALDPSMNKRTILADWLSYSEQLLSFMPRARDGFQLMPYVAAIAGVVYTHCAIGAARRVQVEWPRRDKEMNFKGIQKANILQSVCDSSSIHSLVASKQRIVLDFLPYLLDIISPPHSVRPLPFITLPAPEQHAISDTIRVMEGCGVSYTLSKVVEAEPTKHYNNKFNNSSSTNPYNSSNSTNNGNNGNSGSNGNKYSPYNSHNNNTDLILKLDPAFDELLLYPECDELAFRHVPVVPEMRQVLYTEQRKYSIQIKASKLAGETSTKPSAGTGSHKPTSTAAANKLETESTPYLIMQQQQKDSSLVKRQHSGALEGFFTKTAGPTSKKAKATDSTPGGSASAGTGSGVNASGGGVEKKVFNVNTIRFKFNQGFSNAVKRTVMMDEFL